MNKPHFCSFSLVIDMFSLAAVLAGAITERSVTMALMPAQVWGALRFVVSFDVFVCDADCSEKPWRKCLFSCKRGHFFPGTFIILLCFFLHL